MGRRPYHQWEMGDLLIPTIPDLSGITPRFCCHCGYTLHPGYAEYREGPVCRACDAEIQRGLSCLPTGDEDGEGGDL